MQTIRFTVNGQAVEVDAEPTETLLRVLREELDLIGAKEGCGQGDCGTCTIVMNGESVNGCLVLAAQAEGADIVTLEGLEQGGELHPVQHHFAKEWGFQCGYCTPGMLMSCYDLLQSNTSPTRAEIEEAISGNLCRCTSYSTIVDAVELAAADLRSAAEVQGDQV